MYSITELQVLDYLLKRITNLNDLPLFEKDLKLVIELNSSYWYGDFIQMESRQPFQKQIDSGGDLGKKYFYLDNLRDNAPIAKTWKIFAEYAELNNFFSNPFLRIDDLPLLLIELLKLLDQADVKNETSKLYPYFLNANCLENEMYFPFIHLGNEKYKIVSIIEV